MNKAALKRMTRRTEFYMFLVLIILIIPAKDTSIL